MKAQEEEMERRWQVERAREVAEFVSEGASEEGSGGRPAEDEIGGSIH